MATSEVAKDLFKEVQAAFTPIVRAPNDNDVKRLNEAFTNALQLIDVSGGAIDLFDLLLSNAEPPPHGPYDLHRAPSRCSCR